MIGWEIKEDGVRETETNGGKEIEIVGGREIGTDGGRRIETDEQMQGGRLKQVGRGIYVERKIYTSGGR